MVAIRARGTYTDKWVGSFAGTSGPRTEQLVVKNKNWRIPTRNLFGIQNIQMQDWRLVKDYEDRCW